MSLEKQMAKLAENDIEYGFAKIKARPGEPMTWAALGGRYYTNRATALAAAKRIDYHIRSKQK